MGMLKNLFAVGCTGALICLAGCSGGSTSNANADTLNTTTQVPASNIMLNNTQTSLSSTNMQAAMQEIAPVMNLNTTLVGTWNYTDFNNTSGAITFNANGTYQYNATVPLEDGVILGIHSGTWSVPRGNVFLLKQTSPFSTFNVYYVQKITSSRIETANAFFEK